MKDPRPIRTRAVWLLVVPFFWFAAPTAGGLAVGVGLAVFGLAVRAWAAGTIHKDSNLTTSGPYAFTRNPLYVGSFFIGVGVTLAGGHWMWPTAFLLFYGVVYRRTLVYESGVLAELFGEEYEAYRANVPPVFPRLTPFRPEHPDAADGFSLARYRRNNEWEALLGAVAAFAILYWKLVAVG